MLLYCVIARSTPLERIAFDVQYDLQNRTVTYHCHSSQYLHNADKDRSGFQMSSFDFSHNINDSPDTLVTDGPWEIPLCEHVDGQTYLGIIDGKLEQLQQEEREFRQAVASPNSDKSHYLDHYANMDIFKYASRLCASDLTYNFLVKAQDILAKPGALVEFMLTASHASYTGGSYQNLIQGGALLRLSDDQTKLVLTALYDADTGQTVKGEPLLGMTASPDSHLVHRQWDSNHTPAVPFPVARNGETKGEKAD